MKNTNRPWYVYIVRCKDQTLYTGITNDLERRIKEHNLGGKKGAKYTSPRRPVTLVYQEEFNSRSTACKREYYIKQLRIGKKKELIEYRHLE